MNNETSNVQRPTSDARWLGTLICFAFLLFFASVLHSQGSGVVEGKIVNGTAPSLIPARVAVEAVGLGGGMSVLKSTKSDSSGKFHFDGLPTDQPVMVRADYKSANYHVMISFDSSGQSQPELKVYEPTTSMKGIRVEAVRMAFRLVGDRLQMLETVSFDNQTNPPRTFMSPDGNYRFSKDEGVLEPPQLNVTGPGSSMPLSQSALETADGKSYYSLYPLRPGITTFEVQEELPYTGQTYTLRRRFFQDAGLVEVGLIPQDMTLSGTGLTRIRSDAQRNFAVYSSTPVKAGAEVEWTFSGGTPVAQSAPAESAGGGMGGGSEAAGGSVKPGPTDVGRNTLVIGPLLLMGFVVVLWYAYAHMQAADPTSDSRTKELRELRERLLSRLADLDRQYENQALGKRDYLKQRETGKRQLRRIALILGKTRASGTAPK